MEKVEKVEKVGKKIICSNEEKPVIDHRMHPMEMEHNKLAEALVKYNKEKGIVDSVKPEPEPSKPWLNYTLKNLRATTAKRYKKTQDLCHETFEKRGVSPTYIKNLYERDRDIAHLQYKLKDVTSAESVTALGQSMQRRLRIQEKTQFKRLLCRSEPIIAQRDLRRLHKQAHHVPIEERLDAIEARKKEQRHLQRQFERIKAHFKHMDRARKAALEEITEKEDLWGDAEKQKILERAYQARHEQEEEVKQVNQIIMGAKIHAVRDAQLVEKKEIEDVLRYQEEKYGNTIDANLDKHLDEKEEEREKALEKRENYARGLRQQLADRKAIQRMEAKRIQKEGELLRQAAEAIKQDEENQKRLKLERRDRYRKELLDVIEMSEVFKKMLRDQEHEADMRIAAYMKEKEDRMLGDRAEKKAAKEEAERNQQRMFNITIKAIEVEREREQLAYERDREKLERSYRQKEKAVALAKKHLHEDYIKTQGIHLEETKKIVLDEATRNKKDFEMLINKLKAEQAKQQEQDEENARRRVCYRNDLLKQIDDREIRRRKLKVMERWEAIEWDKSEKHREQNIQAVINAKIQEMRDSCIPEKYIRYVEHQIERIRRRKNKIGD